MIPEDVMVLTVGDHSNEEESRPGVTVGSGGVIFSALLAAAEHLSGTPLCQLHCCRAGMITLCLSVLVR